MYDWREAERQIEGWMAANIHPQSELTGDGADGGVDIRAPGMVAQVKAITRGPVGRPDLQRLLGVASVEHAKPLFFSMSGFSQQAIAWGEAHAMALYSFHPDGRVQPETTFARSLIGTPAPAPASPSPPTAPSPTEPQRPQGVLGCLMPGLILVFGLIVTALFAEYMSTGPAVVMFFVTIWSFWKSL